MKPDKEQAWNDRIPDPEEEEVRDDERFYRDGSVQHECWAETGYTRQRPEQPESADGAADDP